MNDLKMNTNGIYLDTTKWIASAMNVGTITADRIDYCGIPIITKEVDNNKVYLYEAYGIPKDCITYKTEFVNKTKQTYLNITGEYDNSVLGFKKKLNVHLLIDTKIYDSYEVYVEDGLVTVVLHEIINEEPELKDMSK